jgi:hypothetical protein
VVSAYSSTSRRAIRTTRALWERDPQLREHISRNFELFYDKWRPFSAALPSVGKMGAIAGRSPGGRPLRRRREMALMPASGGCKGPRPYRNLCWKILSGNELSLQPS